MRSISAFVCLVLAAVSVFGCARAAKDTSGFSLSDTRTIEAPFPEVWQHAKDVLRDKELQLYTRDKRGTFVAYTQQKRQLVLFTPQRTQLTLTLEPLSSDSTQATLVTLNQVYGVTLLTYPDWHARQTEDNTLAQEILGEIDGRATGKAVPTPPDAAEAE